MKKIGIIGGAGPEAGYLLFKNIIKILQEKFHCKNDKDFPEIHLINYPFSPILSLKDSEKYKSKVRLELQTCIQNLHKCGVDVFVIACNTLHNFIDKLDFYGMSFLHIVDETICKIKKENLSKILVISTETSSKKKLYTSANIEFASLNKSHQKNIDVIINKILSGKFGEVDSNLIQEIAYNTIKEIKAEGIILGCTELSVLQEKYPFTLPNIKLFDPLKILSESCVNKVRL